MAGLERNPHLLADHVVSEPLLVWVPKALQFGYFWVGHTPLVYLAVCSLVLLIFPVFLACVLCFVFLGLFALCHALFLDKLRGGG